MSIPTDTHSTMGVDDKLALKAPLASPSFSGTVVGVSEATVGLGSVDGTIDINKPISLATQSDLNTKVP